MDRHPSSALPASGHYSLDFPPTATKKRCMWWAFVRGSRLPSFGILVFNLEVRCAPLQKLSLANLEVRHDSGNFDFQSRSHRAAGGILISNLEVKPLSRRPAVPPSRSLSVCVYSSTCIADCQCLFL